MKCKLVKLEAFCGKEAFIYTLYVDSLKKTLFDVFLEENFPLFKSETIDIRDRLIIMGHKTGARDTFFKHKEGNPGDGVCALFDNPNSNLRLYCIRYGAQIIILGGGGPKSKRIKALQEDEKLTKENYFLRDISRKITERIKNGDIEFSSDGLELLGDLDFNNDE